ncbi:Translation initiation factor eIF-2B subunit epsilon [Toxocara canis]|uniref:Translation initiation factor eIF2B subunit epsilon n=1 Tax=Toxocara canis TaxID=6265 RepID=A0A0B2VI01_TOXCA|nr:Translation initiation factor eIF-2B subunit epsilon [Toxocara canis]
MAKSDEATLTAVVIADTFDRRFAPIVAESSSLSCLKVANIRILDYTLEWLSRTEIRDVIIVVASSHESVLEDFLNYWKDSFGTLKLVACQNCMSVGDAIREVDARSLISSDFLLIANPATFCSSDLGPQIEAYRERRKDKNNVMTLIYTRSEASNPVIAVEEKTNKLVFYHRSDDSSVLDVDKGVFIGDTLVRRDICDTGIALCSMNISAQFSDNFDFQNRDDVIREIIVNEEILSQYIHVDILPDNVAAFTVNDYEGLVRANRLILQRWVAPLVPGRVGSEQFISRRNNIFFAVSSEERSIENLPHLSCAGPGVIFGIKCTIDPAVTIKNSAIGNGVKIGEGSTITNSIIGDGVTIGCNVSLMGSFIADDVSICDGATIGPRCILANKVSIPKSKVVPSESVICSARCADDEEDIVCSTSERVDSVFEKSDEEGVVEKEMDNTEKFFEELAQKWKVLFSNYYKPIKNQIQALIAIEEFFNSMAIFQPLAAKTVHMFYEEDIVEEDAILEWHESLATDAPIRSAVAPIIAWLQQSDEDSESDE